ncbi:phosphatidate cytidylyltransferase [Anaerotignum sp. MB30-C6]|uniref:phosphatidate cytidylyltransferase n=1 Tax=Anaerotignum sp. MB30-C6 TaxID=3070814 RepID=UPI0027DCC992|nr:phosphatidate cytidylyltransferase [Anaerotignum sp. MB30-C6]WMI79864.1 phosphatidate cytidylyltransferase [Anaerotignum sp. MB30-C6]
MKTRIISALVLLPFLIFVVVSGGLWLKGATIILGLIGMHEFYQAFSKENTGLHIIGYIFASFYGLFMEQIINADNYFNIFVSLFLVVLLIYTVVCHNKTNALDGMSGFFGFFYAFFLLSHIYLIREFAYGKYLVWLAFIAAFGCDTGAYFIGVNFGKHKLIPFLSPKKTIEGSIGGILTATLLSLAYGLWIGNVVVFEDVNLLLLCGLAGFFGSFLAQIGDLAASAMKRLTTIKDFGKLIPGHGGVLDRFDSVILTAPALYYIMFFLIEVKP